MHENAAFAYDTLRGCNMAYKIQYLPDSNAHYPTHIGKPKKGFGGWIVALLLLGAVLWVRFNGVPECLIPGDSAVTKQAVQTFLSLMQEGEPLRDVVTVFCKEVLSGAQV